LTGTDAPDALGRKYTDIFPRFLTRDQEAVAEAFRRCRTVNLKQCSFRCLANHRQADIRISPVRGSENVVQRVQVSLDPSDPCSIGHQLMDAQQLIAIGKIAATLAHGVRNPLNAIKGAVVFLRDRYANEKPLFEFTAILEEEIARLENFISRFLSTTSFDGDTALVDVNELMRKIKVFISLQTSTRNIRCEYHLAEVPPIEISSFHLEQAILNVINNAVEAMETGGTLMISTSVRPAESPPSFLAIDISDTGSGLDPMAGLPVRDHRTTARGRGFGLFIADEIVKYYKGHLNISGKKGKGTTVTFMLPLPVCQKEGAAP
jgi:two-component system nitrogen regulation sensor histidine kinase GlnL